VVKCQSGVVLATTTSSGFCVRSSSGRFNMGPNHVSLDTVSALTVVTVISVFSAIFSVRVGIALFVLGLIAVSFYDAMGRRG
jgi:hypothetical protein